MHNEAEARAGKRRRSLVDIEEERVWASLYRRVADPVIAAELVAHLEKNGEMRLQHSGLYLRCKHVLRREKARQARLRKIGAAIRWAFHTVFGVPLSLTTRSLRSMGTVLLACLPERDDRVVAQLRKVTTGDASRVDVGQEVSPSEIAHPLSENVVTEAGQGANIGASPRSAKHAAGRRR
ncbi:hypothetical protein [Janthinobacterium sp. NKUCC06_STL]|uniref:hypothetical protein n=1 Tax=Janthinobacterium sp. NKUCC06_STL TaxID=2842127 RepID=UPI001C5AD7E3|nr:hypothetical protein [Janthinobacterium sp. NKUCC06_STL]MBW3510643.1 hypothetical protein [Janthinobacterium sp. NKUCC06_STL]